MDAANAAAAASLRAAASASAGADAAAPPPPSDVERIAASLGFDVCSDSDDDDELMSLVPADAAAHAEWVDEDEQFDGAPRTEHEALAPPPAPALADLAVAPGAPLRRVGVAESFLVSERTLVVRGARDAAALVEDSVLCLEDRAPLGAVAEIFGPVREPFYVVRLRDAADADAVAARDPVGRDIFAPADRVAFVRPEELSSRGCDASNVYDEELPDHQQEFSDDEDAQAAKALAKKRGRDGGAAPPPPGAVYEGPPPPP